MSEHAFGIPDAELWNKPAEAIEAYQSGRIARFEQELVLDAPAVVDLQVRQALPCWVSFVASLTTLGSMRARDLIAVVASNVETRELRVATLPDPPQSLPPPIVPPDEPLEGFSAELLHNDLRRRLGIPWQPGRWVLTALLWNQRSNRHEVTLGSPAIFQDPAVPEYIARARRVPRPAAIWPPFGHPLPAYGIVHGAPLPPDEPGVVLAARRVMVTHPGERALLYGSFRLPILRRCTVPPPERPLPEGHGVPPTAVVPIELVITSSASAGFIRGSLRVPSYDPIAPDVPEPVVTGQFVIDLFALEGFDATPQTHFIRAFYGDLMTEPALMALIDPAAVPE